MRKRDQKPEQPGLRVEGFPFPDEGDGGPPVSTFEFLDDEDAPVRTGRVPPGDQRLPYAPVAPRTPWEEMDADYRLPPVPPPPLDRHTLFGRASSPEILVQRARLEFPVLCAWIVLTCLAPSVWLWLGLGAAMVGFSFYIREAFVLCGLRGQAGIYRALGAGQVLYGLATLVGPGPFSTPLACYGLVVLLCWAFVECRQLYYLERDAQTGRYPALYYY